MSVITSPIEAAKMAVTPPMTATVVSASTECSKRGNIRATRKTPAATMVAAWIRALTGVGPSMASGSHTWRGNWADLPAAPAKIPMATQVSRVPARAPVTASSCSLVISKVPVLANRARMAARKPKSPSRVTINAFLAALAAEGRWNQKPINR